MKSFTLWFVFFAALIAGCPKPPSPGPNRPDASDAAPPVAATCSDVCGNVERLGCKNLDACIKLCPRVHSRKYKTCVAGAASCDQVKNCDQGVGNE